MADNIHIVSGGSGVDFEKFIRDAVQEYGDEVQAEAEDVAYEVTVEATKRLRKNSPRSKKGTRSKKNPHRGAYARGWVHKAQKSKGGVTEIIYGKTADTYAIAHLLENGHARRGGGRLVPPAEPKHHIRIQQEWAEEEFEKRLTERIKQG